MSSALEMLGFKSTPTSTPVKPFTIKTGVRELEIAAQNFYTPTADLEASDGNKLAIQVENNNHFSQDIPDHIVHLNKCTALFQEKSKKLKELDIKIMTGITVGAVATTLSFIPFAWAFSLAGFGAALYFYYQRQAAFTEYTDALNLMALTCNWSLGECPDTQTLGATTLATSLVNNPNIQAMMTELYPVLTRAQVKHLIHDDIEYAFVKQMDVFERKREAPALKNIFKMFSSAELSSEAKVAMSKKSAEFTRCVYGYNKGKMSDFADAFLSILPDLFNATCYGAARAKQWVTSFSQPSATQAV